MAETEANVPVPPKPTPEHEWLHRLVGEWSFEMPDHEGGEKPYVGAETITQVGDLWIQAVARGETADGSTAISVTTLGYDPDQQRFVGTFLSSMSTYLWVYSGFLDESGSVLTLESTGPDFHNPEEKRLYRDVVRLDAPDRRTMTAMIQQEDGTWSEMMAVQYRRR